MVYLRYDKENEKWLHIAAEDKQGDDFKIEERLLPILDSARDELTRDLDFGVIIFGSVGSGKSTLGRLCCRYVSNDNFHPREHMVRDVNDIKRVIGGAKNGDAIVFDEASGIFGSADTLTKKTKYAQLVLDVCRQKNLFMVIIAPQFHRLTAPVAIDRTKFALRTFINRKTQKRGHFAYYGTRAKQNMYLNAKKMYGSIKGTAPKFHGEFGTDDKNDEVYRQVKDEILHLVLDSLGGPNKEKPKTPAEIEREYRKKIVMQNADKSAVEIASILGIHDRTVRVMRNELDKELSMKQYMDSRGITVDKGENYQV